MKYIDADRLREALENSIRCYYDFGISTPSEGGELNAYEDILASLDFLQQEQPEEAVEGEVHHCMSAHYVVTNENQLAEALKRFNDGDKVKIIILPKEDKQ